MRTKPRVASWGPELFQDQRLFVSYEVDEDLPYLLTFIGEDNIILGTDYGHTDHSSEIEAMRTLRAQGKLAPRVADKILGENAVVAYRL